MIPTAASADPDEIAFEAIDAEIFRIPDLKTRLNVLQNYFFPRLERLLRLFAEGVRTAYGIDPYEHMTVAYRPAHRKDAVRVKDLGEVYIGLTPGRGDVPLHVLHDDGTAFKYSPSYLLIVVNSEGALQIVFRPYYYAVDQAFRERFEAAVEECWDSIGALMEMTRIAADVAGSWIPLRGSLLGPCQWTSPLIHFPVSESAWLGLLSFPFVALYSLLDTGARLARGENSRLPELIEALKANAEEPTDQEVGPGPDEEEKSVRTAAEPSALPAGDDGSPVLPELDSYRMIRDGKWYQILARDNFTCCGCRRSGPKDGVVLHVDHILPRSKGGTDEVANLQTLCAKCNLGKSNRDNTRLTQA